MDDNNVPDGVPRSYRLPYSRPLADRSAKARDEIMSGKPQQGLAEDIDGRDRRPQDAKAGSDQSRSAAPIAGVTTVDLEQFRLLQQAQRVEFSPMPVRRCRPKVP